MCDAASSKEGPTEGAGEVFPPEVFAFDADAYQEDRSGSVEPNLDSGSPLVVDCSSTAAIAAALDLGDETIKNAFYDKTVADDSKYSDAISGRDPGSSKSVSSSALAWTSARTAPNRFADVIIRESSRLRGRFAFPGDRGLSSCLFGQAVTLPCTDDLLGRGVLDVGRDDFGFDHDHRHDRAHDCGFHVRDYPPLFATQGGQSHQRLIPCVAKREQSRHI